MGNFNNKIITMAMTADMLKGMVQPLFEACDANKDGTHDEAEARDFMTKMKQMKEGPDATIDEAKFQEGWKALSVDGQVTFDAIFAEMCKRMIEAGQMEA